MDTTGYFFPEFYFIFIFICIFQFGILRNILGENILKSIGNGAEFQPQIYRQEKAWIIPHNHVINFFYDNNVCLQ